MPTKITNADLEKFIDTFKESEIDKTEFERRLIEYFEVISASTIKRYIYVLGLKGLIQEEYDKIIIPEKREE